MPTPTSLLLATLWQKNLPQVLVRLDELDAAANNPALHTAALATAHKLAGSLGMYGYPAATDAARAYEHELEKPAPDPATLAQQAQFIRAAITHPS